MTLHSYFNEELEYLDVAENKELLSFEDLRKFRLADEGYFVITDTARPAIVHRVNSKCIKADRFNLKVVINQRKQGSYFWVDSLATAAHEHAAKRCKVCKPELFLVPSSAFDTSARAP
jgi:hypothetical protein